MVCWLEEAPHSAIEASSSALQEVYLQQLFLKQPTVMVLKAIVEVQEVAAMQEAVTYLKKVAT